MNIRRDLQRRLFDIFEMVTKPPQLSVKGSVQPTIDAYKALWKVKTISGSFAGNVTLEIQGDPDELIHLKYGLLSLANANDANGNVQIRLYMEDNAGNAYWLYYTGSDIADNATGYLSLLPHLIRSGGNFAGDYLGSDELYIYNDDYLQIGNNNNQAADTFTYRFKYLSNKIGRED